MAAIIGTSQASMAARPPHTSSSWKSRRLPGSKRKSGYSAMSPPAQKLAPSPATTTQRTSALRASVVNTLRSSRHMVRVITFSLPGLTSVTRATAPAWVSSSV